MGGVELQEGAAALYGQCLLRAAVGMTAPFSWFHTSPVLCKGRCALPVGFLQFSDSIMGRAVENLAESTFELFVTISLRN